MKKHLLVRQRDLTDCGAACVASVCAYFESYVPVSRIRQLAGTDKYGTSILGIVQAAGKLGMDAKAVMVPFDSLTGIDLPAIVHVIINEKINHFIVITMINKHAVIAMDPADGKFREISNLDFKKIWKGITVTLKPGPAFKKYKRISNAGRLQTLVQPYRKALIMAILCAIAVSLIGLTISIYLKEITDMIWTGRDVGLLNYLSLIMITLLLCQGAVNIIKNRLA